jgi:antitoxin YefM
VVMIAEDEWESWMETIHLLSSPRNAERLRESIRQLEAGEGQERELIDPSKGGA